MPRRPCRAPPVCRPLPATSARGLQPRPSDRSDRSDRSDEAVVMPKSPACAPALPRPARLQTFTHHTSARAPASPRPCRSVFVRVCPCRAVVLLSAAGTRGSVTNLFVFFVYFVVSKWKRHFIIHHSSLISHLSSLMIHSAADLQFALTWGIL